MKKIIVAIALLVGFTTMAQRGERTAQNFTPEQMATLYTKKMTLALDLSTEQQTQIQALHLEQAKMKLAKMEERKAMKEKGEFKKPTADERFALQNERLDTKIAHKAKLKKILSQDQYEKWEKMAYHKERHGKGKRKKEVSRKHKREGRK